MSETANTIPPKGYMSLKGSDFVKGLSYILFGAVSSMIIYALSQDHFPTWPELRPIVLTAFTTLSGYIGKNYFTNNEGEVFKKDSPVVTVSASKLEKVVDEANDAK